MIEKGVPAGRAMRLMEITLSASLLVVFVSLVFVVWYDHRTSDRLHRQQIATCQRGNIVRIRVNELGRIVDPSLRPIVIPDCQKIVN